MKIHTDNSKLMEMELKNVGNSESDEQEKKEDIVIEESEKKVESRKEQVHEMNEDVPPQEHEKKDDSVEIKEREKENPEVEEPHNSEKDAGSGSYDMLSDDSEGEQTSTSKSEDESNFEVNIFHSFLFLIFSSCFSFNHLYHLF